MKIAYKLIIFFACTGFTAVASAQDPAYDIAQTSLQLIRNAFDSAMFVYRFESIETPCVYIDQSNTQYADVKRKIINSGYRVSPQKNMSDTEHVKCLSQHCARYMVFKTKTIDTARLEITGDISTSYGYPASSIIQFLTYTNDQPNKTDSFFHRLISSKGSFKLYPDRDKYRLEIVLPNAPHSIHDTIYGYVEIVKDFHRPAIRSTSVYLDKLSIEKGDKNNLIALHFTSTSHTDEANYYSVLAYHILKEKGSDNMYKNANAIWLDNFLRKPECKLIYNIATFMVKHTKFALPNTEVAPPH